MIGRWITTRGANGSTRARGEDETKAGPLDRVRCRLESRRLSCEMDRRSLLARLGRAARRGDYQLVRGMTERLEAIDQELHWISGMAPKLDAGRRWIVLSGLTLRESFEHCTADRDEGMHFIAGVEFSGLALGTRILPFKYSYRSIAGAAGDHRDTHRLFIRASEAGHCLLLLVHSHPGKGAGACLPSATDLATQRSWERSLPLVGAIWSRDGYLRFVTASIPFKIHVIGTQMEQISDDLFRLIQI